MEPAGASVPAAARAAVVAGGRCVGVHRRGDRPARQRGQLLRRAGGRRADRGAERRPPSRDRGPPPAVHACARLRAHPRARRADAGARVAHHHENDPGRLVRLGAGRVGRDLSVDARPRGDLRRQRRRHLLFEGDPPDRAPPGRGGAHRRPRDPVPGDRRARPAGSPAGDSRRQRAADGELARARHAPPRRMGARPELADRRESGRDPARLKRGHSGVPLGRKDHRKGDDVLLAG